MLFDIAYCPGTWHIFLKPSSLHPGHDLYVYRYHRSIEGFPLARHLQGALLSMQMSETVAEATLLI